MKTKKSPKALGNILELLVLAANGGPKNSPSPERKAEEGEVQRFVIASPAVRGFYGVAIMVAREHDRLAQEHNEAHKPGAGKPVEHDCTAARLVCSALKGRHDLLHNLMLHSIHEECPPAVNDSNDFAVNDDWALVSKAGSDWDGSALFPDKRCFFNTFTGRVIAIAQGKIPKNQTYEIGCPIRDGERVIGKVNSPRLRAFMSLHELAAKEIGKAAPEGMEIPSAEIRDDPKKLGLWVENQKLSDLRLLSTMGKRVWQLAELSSDIFWRGVRDTIPGADDVPKIGLRDGWNIVEMKPDSDSPGNSLLSLMLSMALMEGLAAGPQS